MTTQLWLRMSRTWGGNRVPELLIPFGNFACCLTVPLKPFNIQTVALDSLVSAQRSQALTALTLKDISVSENGTRFCVSTLLKNFDQERAEQQLWYQRTRRMVVCVHTLVSRRVSGEQSQ